MSNPPLPPRRNLDFADPTESNNYLEKEKMSNINVFNAEVGSYLFGKALDSPDSLETALKDAFERTEKNDSKNNDTLPETSLKHVDSIEERLVSDLCNIEDGFGLLLSRSKETIASAKDAAVFLKRRAQLEEDYSKHLLKIASSTVKSEGKGGSFRNQWQDFGKIHQRQAEQRAKFAAAIDEIADNIALLAKNTERSRKQLKESGFKFYKEYQDAEAALDKVRMKYENVTDEWERSQGGGETSSNKTKWSVLKANMKLKKVNESESRQKAAQANESYKLQISTTNSARQIYFKSHLPRIIRGLKETIDDCDTGLQRFLSKYCFLVESTIVDEGTIISPVDTETGLSATINKVNIQGDFQDYVNTALATRTIVNKENHVYVPRHSITSGSVPSTPLQGPGPKFFESSVNSPSFGVNLETLMKNDPDESPVPKVVVNLISYIEKLGLESKGLYRISGNGALVQKLKLLLDRDPNSDISTAVDDIHEASGLLKLFFRELPEPLFPRGMYRQLIEAARIDDERMRLIQIHELINTLPDANYATLRCIAVHLGKIAALQSVNKMSEFNLGIVWGPTLIDSESVPDPSELTLQSKVIEVIILNFSEIFEIE